MVLAVLLVAGLALVGKESERLAPQSLSEHGVGVTSAALPSSGAVALSEDKTHASESAQILFNPEATTDSNDQTTSAPSRSTPPVEHVVIRSENCKVQHDQEVRVAVAFFGLFRNVTATKPSIVANLLGPLHEFSGSKPVDIFVHSMQEVVDAGAFRSSAVGTALSPHEYLQLPSCWAATVNQTLVDSSYALPFYADREYRHLLAQDDGNHWCGPGLCSGGALSYDNSTYLDIFRSKYSLWRASKLIVAYEQSAGFKYTHIVAARPDTGFPFPSKFIPMGHAEVRLPNFGNFGGVNDRFAYGTADAMLRSVLAEFEEGFIQQVINKGGYMFDHHAANSEAALCLVLRRTKTRVGNVPLCVVRVRSDAAFVFYDFSENRQTSQACIDHGPNNDGEAEDLYVADQDDHVNACGTNRTLWQHAVQQYGWRWAGHQAHP